MITKVEDIIHIADKDYAYFEINSHTNILIIKDKHWNRDVIYLSNELCNLLIKKFSMGGKYALFNLKELRLFIASLRTNKLNKI